MSTHRTAVRLLLFALALALPITASASTFEVKALIDTDNNRSTGCSVNTTAGPVTGIDVILTTAGTVTGPSGSVTAVTRQTCVNPNLNLFSSPVAVDGGWNVGVSASNDLLIETHLGGNLITMANVGTPRFVFVSSSGTFSDILLTPYSWGGGDIILSHAARHHAVATGPPRVITLDGNGVDWDGVPPLAGDSPGKPAWRFTDAYADVTLDDLFFNFQIHTNPAAPTAHDDDYSLSALGGTVTANPLGVLNNDEPNAQAISAVLLDQPQHGTVTLNANGGFTYIHDGSLEQVDRFHYVAKGTTLSSNVATVTIEVSGTHSYTFTSDDHATFIAGQLSSFLVTVTGKPTPALSEDGALPPGISFLDNGDGTGTLSGTPAANSGGIYPITFHAEKNKPHQADQDFTLTIGQPPIITSAAGTTFTAGSAGSFQVTATGFPTPALSETGALPGGVTFDTGTGILSGIPSPGTGGVYAISITATNSVGTNTQPFNLTVNAAPAIVSSNAATFTVTAPGTFQVITTGFPTNASMVISESGALPGGVTFVDNHNGTATLAGPPNLGTVGSYPIVITANNGIAPNATQNFTLNVIKAGQTVTFTSTAPAAAAVAGPTYNVTATASSSLPVTLTIDASASSVCSISGSTVSFIGAGTCVIDGNQAGNANYNAAPQVQQSFVVGKGSQTVTFTSSAPAGAVVGGATYNATATASSGLVVALTIDASASAVCSISGSTVSFIGAGTCVIDGNQAGNANYNAAPQVQQTFAVGKGSQTLSFTSAAPAGATVGGPTYNVTATSTAGLTVALTIDAAASSVCSISGSTVSFIGVGSCVIDANQAGNANYNAAAQVQQSFAVAKGSQTISFTSSAPIGATVAGPTYNVTATATSGLPVTLTIDATASTVCSISGSTVSFIGAGTCVIDADQPGTANYNAAPQVQQSFVVNKGSQTVTFTSTAPASAVVAGATYNVTATATSGLPVALTIDATASSVCSISGSTVSFIGAGTCVIDANQAGNANYNAAPQVQQSFTVGKGSQTVSFTSTAPIGAVVGGATYNATATATSGLPAVLTIDASASSVCSISGSTVSFIGAGTCVIDANQAGNANYNAAPQVQQTFAVGKGSQTLSFTSSAPAGATVGGPTYNVTATSTAGLTVALTIDASAISVCSISGSAVSFIGVGTCVIDANQPGNANYNAASQVQQSFTVAKGNQTISFTSAAPVAATVAGATYNVTATSTSGLSVALTIDASATSVCSISGSTVSFIGAGTCLIDANQAGNANYNAASQVQQSFTVSKNNQTITFTSTAPVGAVVAGPTYTATATSTSGLPVTLTIDASASSVCSISGSTVSFIGAGTCVIDADQAGNGGFNPAPQVQQSFTVGKGSQTVNFTSTAPIGAVVGGATYNVTATATSALTVALTIDASASSVCSISGSTVSFIGVGTCVIDGNQAGDANYNAAPQAQQTFTVGKGSQTLSFTSSAPVGATVGGPTYNATATSTAGLPVALTIDASASSVCSISGSTVSFIGVGTCVIDANQAGDSNYNAASQVQQSFTVAKGSQTISFTSTAPVAATVAGATYNVTATSTSGLSVALTIDASATSVCSISGSTVSFLSSGTCVIDANQAGNANYNAASQVQQSFTVSKNNQTITFTSTAPVGAVVAGPTYTATATSTSGLPVTLTIDASASSVCSISGSTVSFIGAGTCVIDADQAGNGGFNPAPQVQQSFTVGKGSQTVNFTSTAPIGAVVGGATYNVTATATSALTVALTIDASASSVCSISGSTVSFIGVGTCVIDGNQAGDANYNAAPQAQQTFTVGKGSQTLSFTSSAPGGATVGGPTYNATATSTAGLPVALTIDASATSVCSISGSTVSFIGVGTCVIDANQPGDSNYNAASQVQQSFTVAKGSQTISFTSTAPVAATVAGATYTATATSTSGLSVALTIDASATSVCSISGSTVSFLSSGTCVIDANQAGNANYNAAPQVQQSFTVSKSNQTITFTSTAPVAATVSGPTYTVTATATSGLPVALTIDASASTVCSISGSTVSFIGVGTCVIDANQAGNGGFNPAPQVQQSFAVGQGSQTINFTSSAPGGAVVGGSTYNVTATATSGLTVALTIDAAASSVCTISGSTVSFIGAGTCVINGDQAGDANYSAAPQAQQSFTVGKGTQTISFTSTAPAAATVGGATYNVTATSTSGLTVALTIDATASTVCSISGSTVSFIGAGTCVIDGNQAGDANWNAAAQAQQSFAVGKGSQTITFTSTAPSGLNGAKVGGPTYTATATASSGLTVALTIDATASSVCSISGGVVSFLAAGTCKVDANQAGNSNYNAATQVQQSFQVNQAPSFSSAASTSFQPGKSGQTFTVSATGTPGGASIALSRTAGTVPSGVTFTDNGNGTATIAGTPAAGTQGASPYNDWVITANNGVTPNGTQNFTLNIVCPVITVSGSIPGLTFATLMTPVTFTQGGGNGAIVWSANAALTNAGLAINSSTGQVTGTPSATGTFSVSITATDAGGCTGTNSFTLSVAPKSSNDAYSNLVDNTQAFVTGGLTSAPVTPKVSLAGTIIANDLPAGFVSATPGTFGTTGGGSVVIQTDGTFLYTPKANPGAAAITSDSFTYTVTSNTGGGSPVTSAPATVTLTLANRVWYVKNNGSGTTGQSQSPFTTLAAAQAASLAGDTIYVFNGDGTTTGQSLGVTLKNNQQLIGEGVALVVNAVTLNAAGTKPQITNTTATSDAVTILDGDTVSGLTITGATRDGISSVSAHAGFTADTLTVQNNTNTAIDLIGMTGIVTITNSTISTTNNQALKINGGTAAVTADNTNTLNGGTGTAFSVINRPASAGAIAIGATINNGQITATSNTSGTISLTGSQTLSNGSTNGVTLTTNTGATINFSGTLNITTTTGVGLSATGGGTLDITGTANVTTGAAATGININGVTIGGSGVTFNSVNTTGATTGVSLTSLGNGNVTIDGGTISGGTTGLSLNTLGTSTVTLGANAQTLTFTGSTTAISGATFGTLAVAAGSTVDVSGATALNLATGAVSGTFANVSSTGGTNGVNLSAVTGTWGASAGTLQGSTGATFNVTGGSGGTITWAGNITQATAAANVITIAGSNSNTITVSGAVTASGTSTGMSISASSGTYSFNGTNAFSGTGGGILISNGESGTISFSSNTTNTETGTANFQVDGSVSAVTTAITYNGTISRAGTAGHIVDVNKLNAPGSLSMSHAPAAAGSLSGNFNGAPTTASGISIINSSSTNISVSNATLAYKNSDAVTLTGNTGATITLNGLSVTNDGSGKGLLLSGAGTVNIATGAAAPVINVSAGTGLGIDGTTTSFTGTLNLNSVAITSNAAGAVTLTGSTLGGTASTITGSGSGLVLSGVALTNGAGMTSITSTGGANGISLTSVTGGTYTVSGGALSGNTGSTFLVSGGSSTFTFNGTMAQSSAQRIVNASGITGGTITLGGSITGSTSCTGVTLAGSGGTVNLSGGVTLNGTADVFAVSGAGLTINVTGTNSVGGTTAVTSGIAVSINNSTIGVSGVTFQKISQNGGSTGIYLNNTGNTAGFTVTGTGSAGTGGTIQNTTGANAATNIPSSAENAGSGVFIYSVKSVSLSWMQLNDHQNYAIYGNNISTSFTLDHSVISGSNGNNDTVDEGSIAFDDLHGSATISNSNISGGWEDNLRLRNTTGSLNRLTISNTTWGNNSATFGNTAMNIAVTSGTPTLNLTVTGCTFTGSRSHFVQFLLNGTGASNSDFQFTSNTITQAMTSVSGAGGVFVSTATNATGNLTYNIQGNTIHSGTQQITGGDIHVAHFGTGTFSGTIDTNVIGTTGVTSSGSSQGNGIEVDHYGGGTDTVHVTSNTVRRYNGSGIEIDVGDAEYGGQGTVNLTVTGNTVAEPEAANALHGLYLNYGLESSPVNDAMSICASIGGAGSLKNILTGAGVAANGGLDLYSHQRFHVTTRYPGYAGANNDNTAVGTFLNGQNTMSANFSVSNNVSAGGGGYVGGAACP